MKMNKNLIVLCLSAGLLASAPPGISLADVNYVPRNTSDAPAIPSAALQQLTWTPVDQSKTQTTQLATGGQQLNVPGISGPVAAYSVPANIGELTLTLTSEVNKQTSVFAPNVLILDQNMTPSAFFPSSYFTYQGTRRDECRSAGRRYAPDTGVGAAKTLCSGLYHGKRSPQRRRPNCSTRLKPMPWASVTSILDIPDPVARHTTDGLLKLKVKTNSSSSVLVGPLFGSSAPAPVTVGNTAAPAGAAPAPAPVKKSEPMLNDTESYFNTAIKNAVAKGDVV